MPPSHLGPVLGSAVWRTEQLQDVRAAYFVYPVRSELLDATVYLAQAAKEGGVSAIVNTSQMTSQNHWIGERVSD